MSSKLFIGLCPSLKWRHLVNAYEVKVTWVTWFLGYLIGLL